MFADIPSAQACFCSSRWPSEWSCCASRVQGGVARCRESPGPIAWQGRWRRTRLPSSLRNTLRSFRNSVIMKYGLPSRAGMPTTGASIWARKEPQLLPRSKSGCSRSMMERISFSASLGCKGRSGVSTTAVPSNASFKALAIGQLPVAKNPCRNNIFFMI